MFVGTAQSTAPKRSIIVARLAQVLMVLLVVGGSIGVTAVPADAAVTAARRGDEVGVDC
jgi:hypothetical protein